MSTRRQFRRRALGAFVVALICCIATSAAAQTGAIFGTVVADSARGHPIQNAEVMAPALNASVRTNAKGEFRLTEFPSGRQLVVVRLIGYQTVADTVELGAGPETRHDFVLGERAVPLDSVVAEAKKPREYISPNLNGFVERMHNHAGGYFIDDSTLRKNEDHRLPDVLSSRLAGMRIYRHVGDTAYMVSTRNGGGVGGGRSRTNPLPPQCYATIYLDGIQIYDLARMGRDVPPPDLSSFLVSDLAGVEFYPGSASLPMEFKSGECGTLLLWTREK